MAIATFSFPTAIHFGPGARRLVAEHLKKQGVKRPLIVTDQGLAALPILKEFGASLAELTVQVYSGVYGNPTRKQVDDGVKLFKSHAADAVIGFGGGAALDVAKAVALMSAHGGDVLEYAWDHPNVRPITKPLPYFIALPTTSGTGSEVGRSAVISDDATHVKKIIFHPALLARAVFADPELTLDLPAGVTAATGMDALTHNVESYLSPAYHPLCDGIALEGARIAAHALETAHVMRFNLDAAERKMAELARVCGAGASGDAFVAWLASLKSRIGIPAKLGGKGVTAAHIPRLVDVAVKDTCHQTNPKPVSAADFERIFHEAL